MAAGDWCRDGGERDSQPMMRSAFFSFGTGPRAGGGTCEKRIAYTILSLSLPSDRKRERERERSAGASCHRAFTYHPAPVNSCPASSDEYIIVRRRRGR